MVHQAEALSSYVERRQHQRFSVKLPIDYWQTPETIEGGLVGGISETGLLIYCVHKIEIGAKIGFRVYLSKGNTLDWIEGNAKIMWMSPYREQDWIAYRCGVRITGISSDDKDKLINYLLMLKEGEKSSHWKRAY